jgi:predicted aspartyl protease
MGLTHITTRVSNLAKIGEPYESEFLVDTGAIDCLAPADALHQAGILIEGKDVYELANGELVEYHYGYGRIAFMGDEAVSRIIFGPPECEPLIGVVTLESMGIGVDPVSKTLKRMAAKPLK